MICIILITVDSVARLLVFPACFTSRFTPANLVLTGEADSWRLVFGNAHMESSKSCRMIHVAGLGLFCVCFEQRWVAQNWCCVEGDVTTIIPDNMPKLSEFPVPHHHPISLSQPGQVGDYLKTSLKIWYVQYTPRLWSAVCNMIMRQDVSKNRSFQICKSGRKEKNLTSTKSCTMPIFAHCQVKARKTRDD